VKYIDKTFGYMFETLIIESKMIAIGLYREKVKGNSKYVYIKPNSEATLNGKDKVFVLSYKQPKNGKILIAKNWCLYRFLAEMANLEEEEQTNLVKTLAEGLPINIKSRLVDIFSYNNTKDNREVKKEKLIQILQGNYLR